MRPKVLAVLFLLAACGGSRADLHREPAPHPFGLDEPPRPTPESLLSGVGDFPVPVELGCERALEPERPGYAEQPMDTAYDLAVQARFPDTASDDIWAQNYWLTGNEHAFVTLEVLSGDMYNGPARSLVLTTFVNGIQVAPLIDGIETRKLEFVLEPHSSRVIELEFDERLLPAGMFQIAMPIWDRDSPTMGVGTVVYATRERWCFPDRPSALTGEVGEWDPDWGVMLRIYDPRTDTLPPEVALSLGETLELDLLYAGGGDGDSNVPGYLVALVDGDQVPLEEWGLSPLLQVELGTSLLTQLRISPAHLTDDRVRIDLFLIGGAHQATEDATGNLLLANIYRAWRIASFDVLHAGDE